MDMVTILIQSTALMLALILLRPLLKQFLSARIRCALWAIPALRLLLPFKWESSLSFMAPVQPVAQEVENVVSRPVAQIATSGWLGTGIGMPDMGHEMQNAMQNTAQNSVPVPNAVPTPELSLATILLAIWLLGAIVTGCIILYQNIRFYSGVKRLAEPYGEAGKLPVYLVKGLPSPCLAGVLRPRIYINEQALTSDEVLTMTLRHEKMHYKRLDHIWSAVRGLLLALYWFHPLVWISSELFRCDCETACDAAAIRGLDKDERECYGMALITLASRCGKWDAGRLVCLSTMGGSKKLLKERITQLAKGRTFRFAAVIALLLAVILCCTMCTVPKTDNEIVLPDTGEQSGEAIPPDNNNDLQNTPDNENNPDTELDIVEWEITRDDPALGVAGSIKDFAWCLELTERSRNFDHMTEEEMDRLLSEYKYLLDGYRLMGRVSEDGAIRYIVGEYMGDFADSGFYGLGCTESFTGDQILYRSEDAAAVEESLAQWRTPDGVLVIKESSVIFSSASHLILIQSNESTVPLDGVRYYYVGRPNGRAYILDAVSRGISLGATSEPYLEVYRISEEYGEISERIPLTEKEAEQILSEPLVEIEDGYGINATLNYNGNSVLYMQSGGIPQTVLDLALSRCEYRFASPGDIEGKIIKATLECSWLDVPLYAAEDELPRLREILKGAEFGFVGACGYGAKLTIEMENGETMVIFKGCDSCDSIVFGSYGGYFLGDKQNSEFWQIFGLHPETKELLLQ